MISGEFIFKDCYDLADAVSIMDMLRRECPWDKVQTHLSIRENFIEEVYEALEGIDNNDSELMCEELGDVLLQVLFHARIAQDEEQFDINDIADTLCKKLILRHPHIFSDISADDAGTVLKNWDNIKSENKGFTTYSETLKAVSRHLPAVMRAEKVQAKAAKANFDWQDANGAMDKVQEELLETKAAYEEYKLNSGDEHRDKLFEEVGDLLFAAANVSRMTKVKGETALSKASDKFTARFEKMENLAMSEGLKLDEMSLTEMDKFWDRVKADEKK